MKILHIVSNLSHKAGGLYYSVSGLAKAQHALNGGNVFVLGTCAARNFSDLAEWGDVTVKPIEKNETYYGPIVSACRTISDFDPDIVHQHGIWNSVSVWGRFALLKGIPLIISPRGMLDPWILKRSVLKKMMHGWFLEKPMAQRAHFNALTTSEVTDINSFCPSTVSRTFLVPNGITLPNEKLDYEQKSDAIFLGRLHEKKQVLELVRAWRAIAFRTGQKLVIAGWGDDEYVRRVEAEISTTEGVKFVGPVYGERKSALLAGAKVFILPSLSEGLPMAVLEAISYGCIPIVTKECNLPELTAEGVAEHLELDLGNLEDCLSNIISMNSGMLKARQAKAVQFAQNYSWARQAGLLLSSYEQIVNQRC